MYTSTFYPTTMIAENPLLIQESNFEFLKQDSLTLYETVQEYFATLALEQG